MPPANLLALFAFTLSTALHSQTSPAIPDPTLPPGAPVLLTALGTGAQIYTCTAADTWILQAPQANLADPATGKPLGTHTAGPTWTWTDGSSLHGVVVAKLPSPDPGSIPWLLLAAQPPTGQTHGALAHVTWIRRSETVGGAAPTAPCDDAHRGATARIPYHATYTFFGSSSAR